MKRIQRIFDWFGSTIFIDWILEIITLLVIIYGIWTSMHYFNQLPDNMPSHWGIDGRVDQFSKKSHFGNSGIPTIILYIISSILVIVNSAKAKINRQVFLSLRCFRIIRLSVVYLLLQVDYNSIMDTLKQPHTYTGYLFWVSILLIVGTLAYMIFYSLVKMKHY